MGEYSGRVTEVDWKHLLLNAYELKMHSVRLSSVFNLVLLLFVLVASCAMWYVLLVVWHCWKVLISLMAIPTLASAVSTPGKWTMFALQIHWHHYICACPRKGLWCSKLCVLGSAYLPSSLTRLRAYLWCIWRWLSRWLTSTICTGQPTVGRRLRLSLKALRSFWTNLKLPIHNFSPNLFTLSPKIACHIPSL